MSNVFNTNRNFKNFNYQLAMVNNNAIEVIRSEQNRHDNNGATIQSGDGHTRKERNMVSNKINKEMNRSNIKIV